MAETAATPSQSPRPPAQAGWQWSCWGVPLCRQLSPQPSCEGSSPLPLRAPPLPALSDLCGAGAGREGLQALKGKLLKPLGQEVAERGCFLWQNRGAVRAGPNPYLTACLPRALGGWGELSALLSLAPPPQKNGCSWPTGSEGWGALRGSHLYFDGRGL